MNKKVIGFILAISSSVYPASFAATPGPTNNYAVNAFLPASRINSVTPQGFATRGVLFYDMTNDLGAVDQLAEALKNSRQNRVFSHQEISDLQQILAVSSLLSQRPDAVNDIKNWIESFSTSSHRADMALLLADLLLEQHLYGEAQTAYSKIESECLSPNLVPDYLYHKAYTDLRLAEYDKAAALFADPALSNSEQYGSAANFYAGYIKYINRDFTGAQDLWNKVNTSVMPGSSVDFYKAQIAYINGNYSEALRLAKPLLNKQQYGSLFIAEANRLVGESLYCLNDTRQCIPYLKKYIESVSTPERSTQYILGIAYYEEGNYEQAVKCLSDVTSDQSEMGQSAYLYIGQALLKLNDVNAAILAFDRAITMNYNPDVTEAAYYNYAVAKSRGGDVPFASSVNVFEEFLAKFPNSRYTNEVTRYLVTGYVTDGNYQAALNSIKKVKNPSPEILAAKQKVLYSYGAKLLGAGQATQAVDILTEAKNLAQHDKDIALETNLILGEALYRTEDYDASAKYLLDYLELVPSTNNNRFVALYDLGYTRMAQHQWDKAAINFEKLTQNPGSLTANTLADAQTRLGDALYYQRKWADAATAYQKAYDLMPQSGDYPLFQKAVMLGYAKKYNEKLSALNKLLDEFPTSGIIPDALMEKAEVYIQLKKPEEADNVYRVLIQDYSSSAQGRRAYLFLAADMASNENTDDAINTYQNLIKLAPKSEEAHLAAEAVKRLHADRGTLDEYARFVEQIPGAPTLNTAEAEVLTWNSAEHAFINGKGISQLETYINKYPTGRYAPQALNYLLDNALDENDDDASYRWATQLINSYPDNAAVEDALITKAEIDYEHGRGMDALRSWTMLEQKASSAENVNTARIGMMRVARDIADARLLERTSTELLNSSAIGQDEKMEAKFSLGLAQNLDNAYDEAVSTWLDIADNTDDMYGAQAAVFAAETLVNNRQYEKAAKTAEKFVNAGTPHTYWLARGFIALSDAYRGLGRDFEAQEYLKALKENYPGKESDIYERIEQRLK